MPIKTTNMQPHYTVDIWRDEDPTDPLDTECSGIIHHAYRERGVLISRRSPKESAKLAYALAMDELGEFFEERGQLPSGFLAETAEVDWFALEWDDPAFQEKLSAHDMRRLSAQRLKESEHNAALLKRFGVPATPENIYREFMPPELVKALAKYLRTEVMFVKEMASCGDSYGSHFVWAEKADIVEKWGVDPDNARVAFEDWCTEFQCYLDGDVWGFVIDYVECDDPKDPLEPRYEEPGLESCGGIIGDDPRSVVARMSDYWSGLDGASAITDAVMYETGRYMRPMTIYVPIK